MPELPEVETVANGVDERIRGERIEQVWLGSKPEPFKTDPAAMEQALAGARIDRVRRVGKHIVFDLSRDGDPHHLLLPRPASASGVTLAASASGSVPQWIVHLGMTGRLLVVDASVPRPPHTHAALALSSGRELRFVDARRFGRLALHPSGTQSATDRVPPLEEGARGTGAQVEPGAQQPGGFQGPGREPLSISAADFAALFRGRKLAIKAALLNQSLLHGVGNIYADESLFRAGIRPSTPAGRISLGRLARLHQALQAVLRSAIALGGSSVSDYVDAAGVRGFFQLEHRVYGKTGEACSVCGTPIRRTIIGGRSTHSCPKCQR